MTVDYDIIIIGGGASGLMCAALAGQRGRKVLVLEGSNKVGKKILMSGGGRCNFTNMEVTAKNYICSNPHFVKSALKRYTNWDFIGKVLEYGIPYHERDHGQLFCDDSAKDILNLLLSECEKGDVTIRTHSTVEGIKARDDAVGGFSIKLGSEKLSCSSLVIATGGLSIPTMGAGPYGYQVAKQFGIPVIETRAGLVPFTFSDHMKGICERLSGNAVDVTISCNRHSFNEAVLFTHRGLSGPAVLQISNYWQLGDSISIDLLPAENMQETLLQLKQQQPKSLLRNLLAKYLPKSLVLELQALWWEALSERPIAEFPDKQLRQIAEQLHSWQLKPSGTEGYRTAEVTLGGVDTDYVSSKTMECNSQKGLYFIGEVLDVTGHLGGYNFQWAWSSANAAAEYL